MKLEELEILTVVETIEYRTFKEKIDITKNTVEKQEYKYMTTIYI